MHCSSIQNFILPYFTFGTHLRRYGNKPSAVSHEQEKADFVTHERIITSTGSSGKEAEREACKVEKTNDKHVHIIILVVLMTWNN